MLHPLMPFITEELWNAMGDRGHHPLITAQWPEPKAELDPRAKAEIEFIIRIVEQVRSGRVELGLPPGRELHLAVRLPTMGLWQAEAALKNQIKALERLARVKITRLVYFPGDKLPEDASFKMAVERVGDEIRRGSLSIIADEFEAFAGLEGIVDLEAEKARLTKGAAAAEKERDSLAQRLANPNFTERAKPEAVEKARADHGAKAAEAERLRAALERLG